MTSALWGWAALLLVPSTALGGWILRRWRVGRWAARMRVHYALGYGTAAAALGHVAWSMPSSGGSNATGLWIGAAALGALLVQAFVGASLQAPGAYRLVLRRWHLVFFAAVAMLAIGHIAFDAPWASP